MSRDRTPREGVAEWAKAPFEQRLDAIVRESAERVKRRVERALRHDR